MAGLNESSITCVISNTNRGPHIVPENFYYPKYRESEPYFKTLTHEKPCDLKASKLNLQKV